MQEAADGAPSLTLLPEARARARLGVRRLALRMLCPPYAALGVGVLRVLRVRELASTTELVVGYERYERLPGRSR